MHALVVVYIFCVFSRKAVVPYIKREEEEKNDESERRNKKSAIRDSIFPRDFFSKFLRVFGALI